MIRLLAAVAPPRAETAPRAATPTGGGARPAPARSVIPFQGGALEVTTDRDRTAELVATVHMLQGYGGLLVVGAALRGNADRAVRPGPAHLPLTGARITAMGSVDAVLDPEAAVADLWDDEVERFDARVRTWLIRAEDRAAGLTRARLRDSRVEVLRECHRYLTGVPKTSPDDRELRLDGAGLAVRRAREVRVFLVEVARRRIDIEEVEDRWMRRSPANRAEFDAQQRELAQQTAALQRYVARAASDSPLLPWLNLSDPEPRRDRFTAGGTDRNLLDRIRTALLRCWDSSWKEHDRTYATPARDATGPDPIRQVSEQLDDADTAGPWRFAPILQQATEELGWVRSTPEAAAVGQVISGAGGSSAAAWAYTAGSFVLLTAAYVAAPPVGVAVDLMLTGYDLYRSIERYRDRLDEYYAILDQRKALGGPPSGNEVAANLAAVLIVPLQGGVAVAAGLVPVAMHVWAPAVEPGPPSETPAEP